MGLVAVPPLVTRTAIWSTSCSAVGPVPLAAITGTATTTTLVLLFRTGFFSKEHIVDKFRTALGGAICAPAVAVAVSITRCRLSCVFGSCVTS